LPKYIPPPKKHKPKQDKPKQDKPKQDKPKQDKPKQDKPKQEVVAISQNRSDIMKKYSFWFLHTAQTPDFPVTSPFGPLRVKFYGREALLKWKAQYT
jgi:hypothetical protein